MTKIVDPTNYIEFGVQIDNRYKVSSKSIR